MTQSVTSQTMKRVEDWKFDLIDLSRRNNLLYFNRSKRGSLSVTKPDPHAVFNMLVVKKRRLEFWMPQQEDTAIEQPTDKPKVKGKGKRGAKTAKTAKPSMQSASATENASPQPEGPKKLPTPNQLVCGNLSEEELEGKLKGLQWRSLLDYRERGVRILHVAFGTLNWVDLETKEKVQSPLILVPLELTRDSIRQPYEIAVPPVEEEAVLNPALQVKLKNDYKIDLPPLPEDWETQNLADYFNLVNQAVAEMGWKAEPSVDLGLFNFKNWLFTRIWKLTLI